MAGLPLVAWTITQALNAECGLDVIVSTDDDEIAAIAAEAGAQVPFMRPSHLAQDETATEPVVLHALQHYLTESPRPEAVMLLQATSPLRLPGTLDRAVTQFRTSGVDSMVGVIPASPFLWRSGNTVTAEYDFTNRPRRQELTSEQLAYRETGSLYLTRPEIYEEQQNRLGGTIGLFVMDEREGVDIDTEMDFATAEQQMIHEQHYSRQLSGQDPAK